jgi:DNA repair exonuclease SbcCD nuclease subunit
VKLLHCSDAHLDWSTAGFRRFDDVERALEQTVRAAVDEKVGLYVFTGDLGDPDGGSVVLRMAYVALCIALELETAGIPSVWLAGNHDVAEDGAGTTTLTPLVALAGRSPQLVHTFMRPGVVEAAGVRLFALPYPSLALPYDPAKAVERFVAETHAISPHPPSKIVIATHLQFKGIVPGEETKEMPRGRDVPFPWEQCRPEWLCLGGHYHERQVWEASNGVRVHIAGALARLTHGEEQNRPSFQIHEVG